MKTPVAEAYERAYRLAEAGDLNGAGEIYAQVLAAQPGDQYASTFLAQLLLLKGDYGRGLSLHEKRPLPHLPARRWHGEPLRGGTLFVHGEQGIGDNIQFVRYASLAARRVARVVVGCPPGLGRLIATVPGVAAAIEPGQAMEPPDRAVPILSLPYLMGTRLGAVPAPVPYLAPLPDKVEAWRQRLTPYPGLKVGLVWAGNAQATYDYRRSPGLDPYRQLLDLPGASFFSLQKGDGAACLASGAPAGLVDLGPMIEDFDDTAAVMANLDLVVSSCTSPAHLAGALGRPVWVVLAAFPDWRWLLERLDSPWYPTARLFRRAHDAGWDEVLGRVRHALAERIAGS